MEDYGTNFKVLFINWKHLIKKWVTLSQEENYFLPRKLFWNSKIQICT